MASQETLPSEKSAEEFIAAVPGDTLSQGPVNPAVSPGSSARCLRRGLERVVGVDDVARSSVHLSPGGVEPPDLKRQERAIAKSATRHAHHPVAERHVVPHRGVVSRKLEPPSTRLATRARLITDPSQVTPANAVRAAKLGAVAQRQHGAVACFAGPPEPPAMPGGLVDDGWNPVGSSNLGQRSWADGSLIATYRR